MKGSRQTREARAEAAAAAKAEREHARSCIQCQRAARRRNPDERCLLGMGALVAKECTAAQLRKEQELDKAEIPGQGELFEVDA